MKFLFPILLFLFCAIELHSRASSEPIPGVLIVQLKAGHSPQSFLEKLPSSGRQTSNLTFEKTLSSKHNIYRFQFDPKFEPHDMLAWVNTQRTVKATQLDYELEQRNTPDDPFFADQWTLERISLPEAWDITTGGVTARGDTIVVAITDSGFNTGHLDINSNLWINRGEIPGDGIDNDLNGYVDDIQGWNFKEDKNRHPADPHGHKVAGIIGARGNNDFGAVGVNWEVKLMLFTSTKISDLILAYEYIIEQRKRYNQSDGKEGALVVATNLSLGLSRTFCEDQPIWGSMYDQLGEVGILTGVAAANENYNVEEFGDMPLNCTSDFIIAVNNIAINDEKVTRSAFGINSVDMGAPGEGTITIDLFDEWGVLGGSSAAAPHITGAIALLYSLPCFSAREALLQPAQTALAVRRTLLDGVDPLPNLEDKTATGGRLNVLQSLQLWSQNCSGSIGELTLISLYPNPTNGKVTIEMQTPDFEDYELVVTNTLGQIVYREQFSPLRMDQKRKSIELGNLATGMYTVSLANGREWASKSLIVQK